MEPATTARVASFPSSSSASHPIRKEWRAISDHPVRNSSSNEELDRLKLGGQSDERTIYEVQQAQTDVDYCSIAVDSSTLDNDLLQQRLHDISMQRERLQHLEIDLRSQIGSRSHLIEMQNTFNDQINEQITIVSNLKERLQEREQAIRELELKMDEKDRELRAIKIDNEAAWEKEDLIREQNQEILAYRREHDNYEAERSQQLQQIHELKEHIQEKERQYLKLEEQHRVLQETILYKDEQLREAQAWVQRMDAMQSTLQAELRERTEQFNHFWIGCQRQFADMERLHLQAIQQLQLELAEARQRSGIYTDDSSIDRANSEEVSSFGQTKGTLFTVNEDGAISSNLGVVPNGNLDDYQSFAVIGNAPIKTGHAPGVPFPSSVLGLGTYIPPGQVTALHPFFIPQPGVPHSVPPTNSHISESHMGHFLSMPACSSHQEWQNPQAVADGSQLADQNQFQALQTEQSISSSHGQFVYEQSADGHIPLPGYVVANIAPTQETGSALSVSREEAQCFVYPQPQQKQDNSPEFHEAMKLESSDKKVEIKVADYVTTQLTSIEGQDMPTEKLQSAASTQQSNILAHPLNQGVTTECNGGGVVLPESSISPRRTSNLLTRGKVLEPSNLLDERSLLACIVRAIPAGSSGRVRISSTLPNRLGKMLAPLHWHDYKIKYGKLDDFVAGHPELFVIEGDIIQLREGAQEIISATAAIAKVAAAAAASAPYSSVLPSVAVTPIAQTNRLKKVPSIDSKPGSSDALLAPADTGDKFSQQSRIQNQHPNGVYNISQGLSNVKILSKPKQGVNAMQSEIRPGQSLVHGTHSDGTRLATHTNKGTTNVRPGINFEGKQQARDFGAATVSRRY